MNFTSLIDALSNATIDTLADFDRQAALDAGINPTTVRMWAKLHDVYLGPSKYSKFQRRGLSNARAGGFTLDQLTTLERRIAHLNPAEQWRYRVRLLANPATYAEFEKAVKASVPKRKAPKKQEHTRKAPNEQGSQPAKGSQPAEKLTEPASFEDNARSIGLLIDLLQHGGFGSTEGKEQAVILLTLEQHMEIMSGDLDVLIQRSDGTTMTGAEYLSRQHAIDLNVALIHPVIGMLNAYRADRGSDKRGGKPGPAQRALPIAS
ncbi:hypothetical protein JZY91_03845 [Corynebacterium sp. CNCTC7651]|uniref:hypothetical protein n=1 Tax=Corynebacterium TaxID=1716 RepID=UPI001F255BCF|nr:MULTISPECIES: hypothetical protein [Corynebacterium]UIZ92890.1 hypothetical protein JZY91_03845 [Corynebacterium sp. CNCTC7651]